MSYAAFVLASVSFIVSAGALIALIDIRRRLRRTSSFAASYDEQLTRDAWLEEIEARGEAVLTRIIEVEKRLGRPGGTPVEVATSQPTAQAPTSSMSMSTSPSSAPTPPIPPTPAPPTAPTTALQPAVPTAAPLPTAPSSVTSPAPQEPSPTARMSDERRHGDALDPASIKAAVLRLADEGLDVTAIARRLALGRGEVELLLGLARRPSVSK